MNINHRSARISSVTVGAVVHRSGHQKGEGTMRKSILVTVLMISMAGLVTAETSEEVFPYSVASGDPRPTSVVLWTYLASPLDVTPLVVTLDVATDMDFTDVVLTRDIEVDEMYGGAVKVLATGLMPYSTYYYRFTHGEWMTHVGRTRTAPTPEMNIDPKFAVVYCQDFIDRYYNAYAELLTKFDEDIDFVVNLGDYIYESTGGSDDTAPQTDRTITFEDLDGVVADGEFMAAGSLANYRTIYRTYHSDPELQRVHERWPMIVIWDDHEFSNDHWGATATYTNGRMDEYEPDRRRNAEQAFFEWVPIEVGLGDDGTLDINAGILYPNSRIYRDFIYGANLDLVMTDGRTYRPDHLVPEDAFPGAIAVDAQGLIELLGDLVYDQVKSNFDPYVDMDLLGAALPILKQTATIIASQLYLAENPALGQIGAVAAANEALSGLQSATFINLLFQGAGLPAPFSPQVLQMLPRGVSFLIIGKTGIYSSAGSRLMVIHDTFNLYAAYMYVKTGGAAQEVYGLEQTAWIWGTLTQSPATWKVLSQSVMMTPLVIDFTNPFISALLPADFPDIYRTRLGINVEDFNGFPQKRLEMLGILGVVPNSVAISGDIHSTFVTDHTNGVFEFTGPCISSATLGDAVLRVISSDPILGQIPGLEGLAAYLGLLLQVSSLDDVNVSPSDIKYVTTNSHGFMIMQATPDALHAVMYEIPSSEIGTNHYDDPELDDLFSVMPFTLQNGELTVGQ